MKIIGFCDNCSQDIVDGDHMDCCGNQVLVSVDDNDEYLDYQDPSPEQLAGEIFDDRLAMYRNEF